MATTGSDGEGRGPGITALAWFETSIAIVLISLRFYARNHIKAIGIDDWTMLISLVRYHLHETIELTGLTPKILLIALAGLITYQSSISGFGHMDTLSPAEQLQAVKVNYITQPFGVLNFGVSKASVAFVILRILGPDAKVRKWSIFVLVTVTTILTILGVFFIFFQCNPPSALWTPGLPASCWSGYQYWCWTLFQSC